MALTIEDIAKLSGTSKSTVSRYLNNGSVSKKTKERIKKVIDETGFELNVSASRLKRKKSNLIGVLFEGFESISVQKMLSGVNSTLKKLDYLPFIMLDEVGEEDRMQNVRALVNQGVDGIIYGAGQLTADHIQYLTKTGVPVILIGQELDYIPFRKIDDYQAGYKLGNYLSQSYYEKVVFLTRPETDKAIGIERKKGFIDGMHSIHSPREIITIPSSFTIEDNYLLAEEVLQRQPDLIVGSTDRMIMGIVQFLNENEINIPQQVAVAGFGNYEYGKSLSPSLTSVNIDYWALGKDAAEGIVQLIEEQKLAVQDKDYAIEVIPRKSTK